MKENGCVCFLRGINVSGKNMIKMVDLTSLFKELGLTDISTHLQSGNVLFSYDDKLNEKDLKDLISTGIKTKFGFDVPVLIRNLHEVENIIAGNPYLRDGTTDIEKLYVTILDEIPDSDHVNVLKNTDFSPESFDISGREAFIFCPDGYGRAKLNNNFLEKKLGKTATTRNWKTITAIRSMLDSK